jgi:hypothetical protein
MSADGREPEISERRNIMSENESPKDKTGGEPEEDRERRQTGNLADRKHPVPLFLRGRGDGRQGDAQDEKNKSSE